MSNGQEEVPPVLRLVAAAGEGEGAPVAAMASEDSGEESEAGGGAVSSSASEDSGQASAGSGGRKLSVSLSVNLSDDGDVQLAEAAL